MTGIPPPAAPDRLTEVLRRAGALTRERLLGTAPRLLGMRYSRGISGSLGCLERLG